MARCHLRIYHGPEEHAVAEPLSAGPSQNQITVSLHEILPTLVDAVQRNRGWIHDFDDDNVMISTDLYEVILAYQHYRRPSA